MIPCTRSFVPSAGALVLALTSLTGCTSTVKAYTPSPQVNAALVSARGRGAQPMSVGSVTLVGDAADDDDSIHCRGTYSIKAASGRFSEYFRQALTDELSAAQLYDGRSPTVVNVEVDKLDVSATWGTHLLTSARFDLGKRVSTTQLVEQSFGWRPVPWWACGVAADAFPALVEKALVGFANSSEIVKATRPAAAAPTPGASGAAPVIPPAATPAAPAKK